MKIYNEGTKYESREFEFSDLIGKTLASVTVTDDEIYFHSGDETFKLYHSQDCCEQVHVESVVGDLQDLVGTPILVAEERSDTDDPPGVVREYRDESQTWTFYTLRTIKGTVDIRWYGSSNGYYSESVDFCRL